MADFDPDAYLANKSTKSPFDAALAAEGVTGAKADFIRSIYQQESGSGRNTKTSNAGAVGGQSTTLTTMPVRVCAMLRKVSMLLAVMLP